MWSLWLRKSKYLATVGYKFAAYSHLWIWSTVFIGWVFALIFQNLSMHKLFKSLAWGSLAGPWFFNIISIVYIYGWGVKDGQAGQWVGAVLFTIYAAALMFYQIMFLPDATKWAQAVAEKQAQKLIDQVNADE